MQRAIEGLSRNRQIITRERTERRTFVTRAMEGGECGRERLCTKIETTVKVVYYARGHGGWIGGIGRDMRVREASKDKKIADEGSTGEIIEDEGLLPRCGLRSRSGSVQRDELLLGYD